MCIYSRHPARHLPLLFFLTFPCLFSLRLCLPLKWSLKVSLALALSLTLWHSFFSCTLHFRRFVLFCRPFLYFFPSIQSWVIVIASIFACKCTRKICFCQSLHTPRFFYLHRCSFFLWWSPGPPQSVEPLFSFLHFRLSFHKTWPLFTLGWTQPTFFVRFRSYRSFFVLICARAANH